MPRKSKGDSPGGKPSRPEPKSAELNPSASTPAKGAAEDKLPGEKLQKVLARTGLGSRREMERWIESGRVAVNGKVATLGDRVDGRVRLTVDGRLVEIAPAEEARCILYHKPTGEVCTRNDPEGRRTVFERLPKLKTGRWISIGRLDFNTSGLLLFTTDGELANILMHPSSNIEREYSVRVMGQVDDSMLKRMMDGVMLEDGIARFADVQDGGGEGINHWFYVVLMEGRNREVRRLWESQGLTVSRLKRVRYGEVFIPSKVKQGQWVELDRKEVKSLYRMAEMPEKDMKRGSVKERDAMERQFGKRTGRGAAQKGLKTSAQPRGKSSGRSRGRTPDGPGDQPRGRTTGRPSGRASGRPGGKPAGRPTGKASPKRGGRS
ncbi:MAG: 23S rRNA pseudouridine2605 synthase [Halioglobus sp.]|jgi:23S rRNA pseudouridine2605 synthase